MNVETFELLRKLKNYPVFTVDTVCSIKEKNAAYTRVYLNRLASRGLIRRIQRGLFTIHDDPIIIATHIIWPSYVSLWYALRYHDLTEQIPNEISVLTTSRRNSKQIDFNGVSITFSTIATSYLFGYSRVNISGFEVFMADPEKAIVDSVALRKISITEIFSIVSSQIDCHSNLSLIMSRKPVILLPQKGLDGCLTGSEGMNPKN